MKSDVKGYYAHIDHVKLCEMLHQQFPKEPHFNRLLWQFMRREREFAGEFITIERGIPLDSSLSPYLEDST